MSLVVIAGIICIILALIYFPVWLVFVLVIIGILTGAYFMLFGGADNTGGGEIDEL